MSDTGEYEMDVLVRVSMLSLVSSFPVCLLGWFVPSSAKLIVSWRAS